MIRHADKRHVATALTILIVGAIIIWFLGKRGALTNAAQSAGVAPGSQGNMSIPQMYNGSSGMPFQSVMPGVNLGNIYSLNAYIVPVPSYHFGGLNQIYMPMFGFVGYSSQGVM